MIEKPMEIIDPQALASLVKGTWTNVPERPIRMVRCSLNHMEAEARDFLYVPELFYTIGRAGARFTLLTCREALDRGASAFMVSERPINLTTSAPCLIVDDPDQALSALAERNRSNAGASFVGVTGSVGKSTTKDMIAAMLSAGGKTTKSVFNYNAGRQSVELTLSNLTPDSKYCCAEFSGVGDIEIQSEIFRPNIAVITNILWEHVSRFETKGLHDEAVTEAIIERKSSLIRNLTEGGTAILNRDDDNFSALEAIARERKNTRIITFGKHDSADVRMLSAELHRDSSMVRAEIDGKPVDYEVTIPGEHMAHNSLAALAVIHAAGIEPDQAFHRLSKLAPGFRRGETVDVPWHGGTIKAINETVSSSLPSLRALFDRFSTWTPEGDGRRVAVLGWIGELGSTAHADMKRLAAEAAASDIDYFYTNGEDMRVFNRHFPDRSRIAPHAASLGQLKSRLERELRPGDVVAFKGNRKPVEFSLRRLWNAMIEPKLEPVAAAARPAHEDPASREEDIRFVFGGDTYFGEHYQQLRASKGETNYLEAFGYEYSTENIAPLFERADVSIINLECALTEMERSPLQGRKGYILGGKPSETIQALKALSVDAVLLGNNHAKDYGEEGLRDTLNALADANIKQTGAGPDKNASQEPLTFEFFKSGSSLKLAVISAYQFISLYEDDYSFYSGDNRWGVNNINTVRLKAQIESLRKNGFYVVVSPHWGENYCFRNARQKALAKRIFNNCGADLIIGHGAHGFQEFGRIGNRWVLYSIGNLIFNSEGEYARHGLLPFSFIAEICFRFSASGWRPLLNIYPIISCNQITQFQPSFADPDQFEQLTAFLKSLAYDPLAFDEDIAICEEDGRMFYQVELT